MVAHQYTKELPPERLRSLQYTTVTLQWLEHI